MLKSDDSSLFNHNSRQPDIEKDKAIRKPPKTILWRGVWRTPNEPSNASIELDIKNSIHLEILPRNGYMIRSNTGVRIIIIDAFMICSCSGFILMPQNDSFIRLAWNVHLEP